jgi:Fe-S cluster assembly protein SufD
MSCIPQTDLTKNRIEEISSSLAEPAWLSKERRLAWEKYIATDVPDPKADEWRTINLNSLDLSKLKTTKLNPNLGSFETALPDGGKLPKEMSAALKQYKEIAGFIWQTEKGTQHVYLDPDLQKKGVILLPLSLAVNSHAGLAEKYLTKTRKFSHDNKFSLLTEALFNSGIFVYIPKSVEIEKPFLLGFDFVGNTCEEAVFSRLLLIAERNSKANIVNVLLSSNAKNINASPSLSLVSQLNELYVEAGAKLSYAELQDFGQHVFYNSRLNNYVHKDAHVDNLSVAIGAAQSKVDVATYLQEQGANSEVLGVVFGTANECFSYNTIQEHNAPDTQSDINFRVALKDQSKSMYQGIIRVDKKAQKTEAFQSNKNLLLSNGAKADSIPKLEILADDVKCSHGATVGPVDPEQLFYLMSRGLSQKEAEEFVVLGFFNKVLAQFPVPHTLEWLQGIIGETLCTQFQSQAELKAEAAVLVK